jgi:hypothetical protein
MLPTKASSFELSKPDIYYRAATNRMECMAATKPSVLGIARYRHIAAVGCAALAAAVFVLTTLQSPLIPTDDAFITYRYAANLSQGHGLVYNHGEHVLGTTSPGYAGLLGSTVAILNGLVDNFLNLNFISAVSLSNAIIVGLFLTTFVFAVIRSFRWLVRRQPFLGLIPPEQRAGLGISAIPPGLLSPFRASLGMLAIMPIRSSGRLDRSAGDGGANRHH